MVLKDVRPIITELVRLKKSIPLEVDVGRYLPEVHKNKHGDAVRSGIKKALRVIEQAPRSEAIDVVRCKDCKHGEKWMFLPVESIFCNWWQTSNHRNGYCNRGCKAEPSQEVV